MNRVPGSVLLVGLIVFFSVSAAFSAPATYPVVATGKYFTVYAAPGVYVSEVLSRLAFTPHRLEMFDGAGQSQEELLAQTLDALYLEVSDILDIHMYSYHGYIAFVPNRAQVQSVFRQLTQQDFAERSFYLHDRNIIYISVSDLSSGMLGHEIGHAILSHFFVVPPPTKVQEVLAGYVEYSLRKASGTLPGR